MLSLMLRNNKERIRIYDERHEDSFCTITIADSTNRKNIKLAFDAPDHIRIVRDTAKVKARRE